MPAVTLIFPHQLFKTHPAVHRSRPVYLVEETLFFNQFSFHKKKLVLHRASMKAYAAMLIAQGCSVTYIEAGEKRSDVRELVAELGEAGIETIHYADVTDDWLQKRLLSSSRRHGVNTVVVESPMFLNATSEAAGLAAKNGKYFQTDFYIAQRKKRRLLLEADGKPVGGKWSLDAENRSRFPKGEVVPVIALPKGNPYVTEAIGYVETHFGDNYGNNKPPFFKKDGFYPVTHDEALLWLQQFFAERFQKFGIYEDAMVKEHGVLYHSAISLLLNTGLLMPQQVIDQALDASVEYDIPLNSLEGFVRQVVGWREYIRLVYEAEGVHQRTRNFWGFHRRIPPSFWNGTTGIHPVDVVIQKTLQNGYAHHIERLMVMGNFMLLCEFHPDDVHRWFMEMYIDAYDWVMVPNTYGMTQFADGGLMMTKPYISGSNYLMKMGNWDKGPWQETWDALFWRFMHVHRSFFEQNPRLGMLLKSFDRFPDSKRNAHLGRADAFLATLDEHVPL